MRIVGEIEIFRRRYAFCL